MASAYAFGNDKFLSTIRRCSKGMVLGTTVYLHSQENTLVNFQYVIETLNKQNSDL